MHSTHIVIFMATLHGVIRVHSSEYIIDEAPLVVVVVVVVGFIIIARIIRRRWWIIYTGCWEKNK